MLIGNTVLVSPMRSTVVLTLFSSALVRPSVVGESLPPRAMVMPLPNGLRLTTAVGLPALVPAVTVLLMFMLLATRNTLEPVEAIGLATVSGPPLLTMTWIRPPALASVPSVMPTTPSTVPTVTLAALSTKVNGAATPVTKPAMTATLLLPSTSTLLTASRARFGTVMVALLVVWPIEPLEINASVLTPAGAIALLSVMSPAGPAVTGG